MNTLLEVNHLEKSYDGTTILHDLSFKIQKGEIVGLIGKNGSGKTTLMKAILGLITVDSGEIYYQKKGNYTEEKEIMNEIGYLLDCELFEYMNAYDNLFIQEKYKNSEKNKDEITKLIIESLDFVGLENNKKKVKGYSFGMKQRLGLALALMGTPKLLILDEPFVGLDPVGVEKFKQFIYELNQNKNVTVLISSHQLSEIEQMCNRYLFISDKNVVEVNPQFKNQVTIVISKDTAVLKTNLIDNVELEGKTIKFSYDIILINQILSLIYENGLSIESIQIGDNYIEKLFREGL